MDVLGFNNKINANDFDFKTKYEALITKVGTQFDRDPKATIYAVSDSIIMTTQNCASVKAYTKMIYEWGMLDDFWLRGAIAQGDIETIDSTNIVRENKNIIMPYMGEAYLTAYNLEFKLNMAGIVIDRNVVSDHPDLPLQEDDDYIEYQEYLPKEGNECKKRILLPSTNEVIRITEGLHFTEMLGAHAGDIDKYINTFCFYVKLLITRSDIQNVLNLLDRLIKELNTYCQYLMLPPKTIILFVAAIDGLFMRTENPRVDDDNHSLNPYILKILEALKNHGYLSMFIDYLLEYDKKRETALYEKVHTILFDKGKK